ALSDLALAEERGFFRRNDHLVGLYRNRLIAIALCQGAALQYIKRGYGVNDFDIHYFYSQNPKKPRLSRAVKRVWTSVGGFGEVAVDFVRTVVPSPVGSNKQAVSVIRTFLRHRVTPNARHLAMKAVIGIYPKRLFGFVIWPDRSQRQVDGTR